MKIGFISPYLDTLGGGERYLITLASHWSKKYQVTIFWDDSDIMDQISNRLKIDIRNIRCKPNFFLHESIFRKVFFTNKYDLLFYLSDGSVPFSYAKYNIIHFQRPFHLVRGKTILNKYKLSRYQSIVVNSNYTKQYIDSEYGVDSKVIYPPVDIYRGKIPMKKKLIISVGRFSNNQAINKKQYEIVNMFKSLYQYHSDWRLVLAGGMLKTDQDYVNLVKKAASNFPIDILVNISHNNLLDLYKSASIYWHAAGLGIDERNNPSGLEHFGITTVEAMSYGCIPVVYNGGGQKEIIDNGFSGFLFDNENECIKRMSDIMSHTNLYMNIQECAQKKSKDFCQEKFYADFDLLIRKITS